MDKCQVPQDSLMENLLPLGCLGTLLVCLQVCQGSQGQEVLLDHLVVLVQMVCQWAIHTKMEYLQVFLVPFHPDHLW